MPTGTHRVPIEPGPTGPETRPLGTQWAGLQYAMGTQTLPGSPLNGLNGPY